MEKNKIFIKPEHQYRDIEVLGKLLPVLQLTKQGADLAEISMITGTGRSVELAFTDGSRQEFVISKDLHGLKLIKKIVKALQGQVEIY